MSGSSAKQMIAKRSLKCWFTKSRRQWKTQVIYCRTENEKISGSGVVFHQSLACKRQWTKRWLKWNFVREDNFTEASNEQLECKSVTSFTGKLKAAKNGWRNRMKQPALITVVWH